MGVLVTTKGDQPPLAVGRLLPAVIGRTNAAVLGQVRVLAEVRQPLEGEDEAEDGRVHDQLSAVRVVVPPVISRVVGTAPPSADDVADVHSRVRPIGLGPPLPARVPNVDARVGAGHTVAPRHVAPIHAA